MKDAVCLPDEPRFIHFPARCPFCKEDTNVEYDNMESSEGVCWQKCRCLECNKQWNEVHHAYCIEEIDDEGNEIDCFWPNQQTGKFQSLNDE